ncbi:hypothetical protein AMTRI_Chr13g86220 [Amborella trichopoda]|uniref:Myb/SANT-like domain-containing protein n=1 Tax=Amborella trichopoda TaxID=13333 RepID=W1NZB7_AMBTC|nr:hypothetical protein AMTR_s00105p00084670 [Amborella trichopoda]
MDDEIMEVESTSSKAKRIRWTHRMEVGLLYVLVEQVQACGKRKKDFKLAQWNAVEKAFMKATGIRRENFKNKFKTWGKNYNVVKALINRTGFGWDLVRQTVNGTEDL